MKTLRIRLDLLAVSFVAIVLSLSLIGGRWLGDAAGPVSAREHNVMAVLWFQTAAETRALQLQAYNWARIMLDNDLAETKTSKKRAVIVDIDETILDNSPYEGKMVRINRGYPFQWDEWIDLA
ncbi:MAG: HAD family acid phosphatase, partial [Bacteroidota bacterium]